MLWLIWAYEGDNTLWDLMQRRDWPYNLEPILLGRELDLPKGPRRKMISLRLVMQQVLPFSPWPSLIVRAMHFCGLGLGSNCVSPQSLGMKTLEFRDLGFFFPVASFVLFAPDCFVGSDLGADAPSGYENPGG